MKGYFLVNTDGDVYVKVPDRKPEDIDIVDKDLYPNVQFNLMNVLSSTTVQEVKEALWPHGITADFSSLAVVFE